MNVNVFCKEFFGFLCFMIFYLVEIKCRKLVFFFEKGVLVYDWFYIVLMRIKVRCFKMICL